MKRLTWVRSHQLLIHQVVRVWTGQSVKMESVRSVKTLDLFNAGQSPLSPTDGCQEWRQNDVIQKKPKIHIWN